MKKLTKCIALAASLSAAGISSAYAGNSYFEGATGMALHDSNYYNTSSTTASGTDAVSAYRFAYGYVSDVKNKVSGGLEFSYNYLGEATYNTKSYGLVNEKTYAWALAGVVNYDLSKNWTVFGKAGMALLTTDTSYDQTVSINNQYYDADNADFAPLVGAGIRYNITDQLGIDATVTHYVGDSSISTSDVEAAVPSVTTMMVGVRYAYK
ncbi:outer membrane protein [Vibrio marisflavi]|nr:outer membrane beta-barrel protein [Vibrio marisflavi]